MTAFWDMPQCSLVEADVLMMEAVSTYETVVYFCETTQHHIPESCHLHRRSEKLKSHQQAFH
jgi:hypothetical protein